MKKKIVFIHLFIFLFTLPFFFKESFAVDLPSDEKNSVSASSVLIFPSDPKKKEIDFPESVPTISGLNPKNKKIVLSFHEAVQLALKNNLKVNLAAEQTREAKAKSFAALGGVLPNISGDVYQNRQTINLAALGLTPSLFPGLDSTKSGPFDSFDARIQMIQNIFNLESIFQLKAARTNAKVLELKELQARQQIIAATAQAYLSMIQAKENIRASDANLKLAKNLLKLAQNQNLSGFATGIDIARAKTRIAEEEAKFIQAKTDFYREEIRLKRIVGISLDTSLEPSSSLRYRSETKMKIEDAMKKAESERLEIRIAKEEWRRAKQEQKAAISRQIPYLYGTGDYGASGNRPDDNTIATYKVGAQINIPIFDGAKTLGEITAAKSRQKQSRLLLEDLNNQIEEEIRVALKNLESSRFLVEATEQTLNFSLQELKISLERFSAGLSGNIEVVTAQTNVALSRQKRVEALTQYYLSQINLAVALGEVENFEL